MSNRVVVTGMGCISAAGHNVKAFTETLFSHHDVNTIAPVSAFKTTSQLHIAAEVKNYEPTQFFSAAQLKQLDRFAQFALISAQEAIDDAQITFSKDLSHRTCVIHGTSIGGQETIEKAYQQLFCEGKKRTHPFTVPKLLPSSATSQISMKYGIKGPAFSTSSACSSSGHAIAIATMMLRCNMVDVAIVGGAEACITEGNFLAWDGLRVLSTDTCRPFCATRSGLVIGEGAGTLILETQAHAQKRHARIYAEISGIGMSSDAHNLVQPLAEGAEMAMTAALADGKLNAEQIQYINAHGSGTLQNDRIETQAIHQVFKGHAKQLKISSTKSIHGHVLGAGAAIESIATIIAMNKQMLPPTRSHQKADQDCDLNYVVNHPSEQKINHAMSNSFAFGGLNVALLLSQYNQPSNNGG